MTVRGLACVFRPGGAPTTAEEMNPLLARMGHRGVVKSPWLSTVRFEVAAVARLDDRDALADRLALDDRRDDASVVAAAIERWGQDAARHLHGEFAFIAVERGAGRLIAARDRFGVEPLVYARVPGGVILASEVGAVLAHPGVSGAVNRPRIGDFLLGELEGIDEESTFFRDVYRLPPGHGLVASAAGLRIDRYATLTTPAPVSLAGDRQYDEAFLEHLSRAVHRRMGPGPVASMLSGGLDSSAVVAMARARGSVRTFTVLTRDPHCAEARAARAVIDQGGVQAEIIYSDRLEEHRAAVELVLDTCADPFDIGLSSAPLAAYSAAKRRGVSELLDGVPGDLLLDHGRALVTGLLEERRFGAAAREALGWVRVWREPAGTIARHFAKASLRAVAPVQARAMIRESRIGTAASKAIARAPIDPEFARELGMHQRLRATWMRQAPMAREGLADRRSRLLAEPWSTAAIERYERVSARLGVEARHPYLDHDLVRFCLALPWQQTMRGGWNKLVARRALDGALPSQVAWRRTDTHVGPAIHLAWVRLFVEPIQELLHAESSPLQGVANLPSLRRDLGDCLVAREGHAAPWRLMHALALGRWLERHRL